MSSSLVLLPLLALLAPVRAATTSSTTTVVAAGGGAANTGSCGWNQLCGKASPCCSEFGYCGTGSACLGGCNPLGSASPSYCAPIPICQNANYTFTDTSRIQLNSTAWNGNASAYDFTLDHRDNNLTALTQDGALAMVLTQAGGGTRYSSTRGILYGTVEASIKTIGATGVVTAFITMSGVKDEIDWETTTNNTRSAQTNYYWQGDVAGYTHGGSSDAPNHPSTFIIYGVVWTPDQLQWTVNGNIVRTLSKESTLDPVVPGLYHYPQTPSRIQLSVWPAGIPASPAGTIQWAGGLIDWASPAYTQRGFFAAYIAWISVSCYVDPSLVFVSSSNAANLSASAVQRAMNLGERATPGATSYIWGTNNTAGQIAVTSSNAPTIINSPLSTGQNMLVASKSTSSGGTVTVNPDGSTTTTFPSAAGTWWTKLPLVAHIGIIIGGVAAILALFILLCTCYARSKDKKQKLMYAANNDTNNENIALVEKSGAAGPSWTSENKEGRYTPSNGMRPAPSPRPLYSPRPSLLQQQQQQQNGGQQSPQYVDNYLQQQQLGYNSYQQSSYDGSNASRPTWPDERGYQNGGGVNNGSYGSNGRGNIDPYQYGPPSPTFHNGGQSAPPSPPMHYSPPSLYQNQMRNEYFGDGSREGSPNPNNQQRRK